MVKNSNILELEYNEENGKDQECAHSDKCMFECSRIRLYPDFLITIPGKMRSKQLFMYYKCLFHAGCNVYSSFCSNF